MKKLLLFLFCVPIVTIAQQTYVPDDNFEQYLIDNGYDIPPLDDYVYTSQISNITQIITNPTGQAHTGYGINDLTGIEDFNSLEILVLRHEPLSGTVDLSNLLNLQEIGLGGHQYDSWNVSVANIVDSCNFSQLILGNKPNLTSLSVVGDINNNSSISNASISISSVDITQCPNLEIFQTNHTQLNSILFGQSYPNLHTIDISQNELTSLNLDGISLPIPLVISAFGNNLSSFTYTNLCCLAELHLQDNDFQNIDLTLLEELKYLNISNNPLNSIDLCFNINLEDLYIENTNIVELDITKCDPSLWLVASNNPFLTSIDCRNNPGTTGLWSAFPQHIEAENNPLLDCVQVNDEGWAFINWSPSVGSSFAFFDNNISFSNDCNYNITPCNNSTEVEDFSTNKELLKVTDLLGREVNEKRNTPLFYIYDDGTVEKKIIIE
ncbi:MAG: hypothetical protein CMD22_04765 [Flavobacteriales bacterium]|nr:hypothetical protein [Flavobacteriales bacterium]